MEYPNGFPKSLKLSFQVRESSYPRVRRSAAFIFGEADDPIVGYGCYKAGDAVFTNVFKDADGKYTMLISPVTMEHNFDDNFPEFLERISEAGVTHHSSLIYGASVGQLKFFAEVLGLRTVVVDG